MANIENSVTPWIEESMEKFRWLDECLCAQPSTVKEFQAAWQANKYLVQGKMYAYIGMHDPTSRPIITCKLPPAFSELLQSKYTDIIPGYYMNKTHWSTVFLDGAVQQEVICDIVQSAYKHAVSSLSKKAQLEILGK